AKDNCPRNFVEPLGKTFLYAAFHSVRQLPTVTTIAFYSDLAQIKHPFSPKYPYHPSFRAYISSTKPFLYLKH
ncbi:14511_t:CDS:1, partial [Cetraspora pellucida]